MTLKGRKISRTILTLVIVLCATVHAEERGDPEGIIQPFNYEGVELLDGRLKAQFEQVRDYYMALRDNDILKGFRERTGKKKYQARRSAARTVPAPCRSDSGSAGLRACTKPRAIRRYGIRPSI